MRAAAVLRLVLHHRLTHCWKGTEKKETTGARISPATTQKAGGVRVLRSVKVWELDPRSRAKKLRGLQRLG